MDLVDMAKNSAPLHANNLIEMTAAPRISVVIPTLNVEAGLAAAIGSVRDGAAEIIVADGGSTDGTHDVAKAADARIVGSDRGRGQQLCIGGAAATEDWILFLHADTRLSASWESDVAAFAANAVRCAVISASFSARYARILFTTAAFTTPSCVLATSRLEAASSIDSKNARRASSAFIFAFSRSSLGSTVHTSERRGGVHRRQMELKDIEVCRD